MYNAPQIHNRSNIQPINDNQIDPHAKFYWDYEPRMNFRKNSFEYQGADDQNSISPSQFSNQPIEFQVIGQQADQSPSLPQQDDVQQQHQQSQFNKNQKQERQKNQQKTQTQGIYQNYNQQVSNENDGASIYLEESLSNGDHYFCQTLENQSEQQKGQRPAFQQTQQERQTFQKRRPQNEMEPYHYIQSQKVNRMQQKKERKLQHKYEMLLKKQDQEDKICENQFNNSTLKENSQKKKNYHQQQQSKRENKKKEGEKHRKLLKRVEGIKDCPTFTCYKELRDYYWQKITDFRLDVVQKNKTIQQFSYRKSELVRNLLERGISTKNGQCGYHIVLATMLIDKYFILMKNIEYSENYALNDWIQRITKDIRISFNKEQTSKALMQIYQILDNQKIILEEIEWKKVIEELHYQLEVSKNFYKSHCCGYYQFFKNKDKQNNQNFEESWYRQRSEYNKDNQCKGSKGKFKKLDLRKVKDCTLNGYLDYTLKSTSNRKIKEIYVDDLFNIIPQIEEF